MRKSNIQHPIRRIRDSIKATPKELGLSKFGRAKDFADLIGRSTSLIYNVESGFTKKWGALAELIERKLKVSKEWMLSENSYKQPIRHVNGGVWDPRKHLDPLAAKGKMPNWRKMMDLKPEVIPRLIAELIHARLVWDLAVGDDFELRQLATRIQDGGYYDHPGMQDLIARQTQEIEKSAAAGLWQSKSSRKISIDEINNQLGVNLETITLQQAEVILEELGARWFDPHNNPPSAGPLAKFSKFYLLRNDPNSLNYGDVED